MHTMKGFRLMGECIFHIAMTCFNLFGLEMDQWVAELLWGYVWVRCLPNCVA